MKNTFFIITLLICSTPTQAQQTFNDSTQRVLERIFEDVENDFRNLRIGADNDTSSQSFRYNSKLVFPNSSSSIIQGWSSSDEAIYLVLIKDSLSFSEMRHLLLEWKNRLHQIMKDEIAIRDTRSVPQDYHRLGFQMSNDSYEIFLFGSTSPSQKHWMISLDIGN